MSNNAASVVTADAVMEYVHVVTTLILYVHHGLISDVIKPV